MKSLLRFAMVAVNTVLVLLACATVAGRVLMLYLDELEAEVNTVLARFDVQVSGLRGSFRGIDPVLRIDGVRFPGGKAKSIVFQLDLIESATRATLVAHTLTAGRIELTPVRTLDGRWTLGDRKREAGGAVPDVLPFFEHSDHLHLPDVRISFAREAPDNLMDPLERLADFVLSIQLDNDLRHHAGAIRLAQADDPCTTCALDLRWAFEGLFGRIDRAGAVSLSGDGFRMPAALGRALGVGGATFARLDGGWRLDAGDGSGRLVAELSDIALPAGDLDRLELTLHGTSRLWNTDVLLAADRLWVRAGERETRIEGLLARFRSGLGSTVLEWSVPSIDIATQVPLVAAAFARMRWSQEWLPALSPRGRVESLSGRFDFDTRRLALAGDIRDVELDYYKNSPYVRRGNGRVVGSERGFLIHVDGRDMAIGMFDFYTEPTVFDTLTGQVHLWFKDRYLQVRGERLEATLGAASVRGTFAVSRPQDPLFQHVSAWVRATSVDALAGKRFVPIKLSEGVRSWIDRAVVAGTATDAAIAFHGYIRSLGELPVRRTEIRIAAEDAAIRFHEDWPLAAAVDGTVFISDNGVRADLTAGTLRGITLESGSLDAPKGAAAIRFVGRGRADGVTLRHLVDDSPLSDSLAFLRPDWRFAGPVDYRIDLTVPVRNAVGGSAADDAGPPGALTVAIDADLRGVDADLANIGLSIEDLRGPVEYRYPYDVRSPGLTGRLFGTAATFDAESQASRIRLGFEGNAPIDALERWLGVPLAPQLTGTVPFDGELDVQPGGGEPVAIAVRSTLTGTTVDLPAPFGKPPEAPQPLSLAVTPRDDGILVTAAVDRIGNGWLRLRDEHAPVGSFVLGDAVPAFDPALEELTLTGAIAETDLGPWLSLLGGGDAQDGATRPALGIKSLRVERLRVRDMTLEDLLVDAFARDGAAGVTVVSAAVEGSLDVPQEGPMRLEVRHLRLPGSSEPSGKDPLDGVDMSFVDAVDVAIEEAAVGDESYGGWRFAMRRDGDEVRLESLVGNMRGLGIESTEPLVWRWRGDPQTRFTGKVRADDLAPVLVAFGYAKTVETKKAVAEVALRWPGSPLNFSLAALAGTVDARAEDGRFLEVESGAGPLRMFSLLNFTAIAKRMALDFSDVFGKGVSFEILTTKLAIENQKVELVEPLVMDGTGGYFRVSGRVDLATGTLDNEMIVTLPVNKSLPWYAAYLSFVNPIAAGAVLVGERIFRNQIQQFSSATYKVSGTLDDPKVDFVGVFGRPSDSNAAPAAADSDKDKKSRKRARDAEPS